MLSNERLEPCRDGGLLPAREPGREFGFEPGLEPPGVSVVRNEIGFLVERDTVPLSLSDRESGVLAVNDVRDVRDWLPIGTERADLSRTLVIGPVVGVRAPDAGLCEADVFGLNAVIDCETPSASIKFSRSSMLVRPLALHGSFLSKNSSNATQPPPTRTITVLLKIRTRRNF